MSDVILKRGRRKSATHHYNFGLIHHSKQAYRLKARRAICFSRWVYILISSKYHTILLDQYCTMILFYEDQNQNNKQDL